MTQKGDNQFTQEAATEIKSLLAKKNQPDNPNPKQQRDDLRDDYHFYISDFTRPGDGTKSNGGFGPEDFDRCVRGGLIKIID